MTDEVPELFFTCTPETKKYHLLPHPNKQLTLFQSQEDLNYANAKFTDNDRKSPEITSCARKPGA